MPQLGTYPVITTLAANDQIPIQQEASGALKLIEAEDLATEVKALAPVEREVTTLSSNTTLSTQDVVVGNSGGGITLTLPDAATNEGKRYYISNRGAGAVTVEADSGDTINGDASVVLAQYEGCVVISVGNGLWQTYGAA